MIIYKDIITGDELFTDSNKVTLVDDCLYEVLCTFVTRKQGNVVLAGSNPSAEGEDGDEGTDEQVESGLDVVLNQRLMPTTFTKADYKTYIKGYVRELLIKLKENGASEQELDEAKAKLQDAFKLILPKLTDAQFFTGESGNVDGMVAILDYRSKDDGTEDAIMLFYKHGLEAEKV